MKKFNMKEELLKAGFEAGINEYGFEVFRRNDVKLVETAWYGTMKSLMSIEVGFNSSETDVTVRYFDGGKRPFKVKSHQAGKRAWNAIAETMKCRGFCLQ